MKKRSVTHATFTVERTYDMASPAQVFNAWTDPVAKARWFGGGDDEWENEELTLEFRVGGRQGHAAGLHRAGRISRWSRHARPA